MAAASKKHHYVPRFLLKNFYDKNGKLYVFDKLNGKIFVSNADDSGHENNFNTVELGDETFNFEELFDKIDFDGSLVISKIIKSGHTWDLSENEMLKLAIFVAAQFLRTKTPRKQIEEFNLNLNAWMDTTPYRKGREAFMKTMSKEEIKLVSLMSLEDIEDYKHYILERDLVIIRTTDEDPFYISDNPVKLHSSRPDKLAGLKVVGTNIYFPIAPTLLLGFMCKTTYPNTISNISYYRKKEKSIPKEIRSMHRGIVNREIINITSENVEFYNHFQVGYSSRFIYSFLDDFSLAEKMILARPSIKDGPEVLTVGGNFYANLPNGEIAIISLTEEHSATIEVISLPSKYNIAIKIEDKTAFDNIASIKGDFYGIEIFKNRQLARGMKHIRISSVKKDGQIIEFEHSDPGIEQILKMSQELADRRKKNPLSK